MNRSRLRIVVVAVLIAVVVAPSLASASSLGLSHPSGSVLQQALAPLARAWGWLSGIRSGREVDGRRGRSRDHGGHQLRRHAGHEHRHVQRGDGRAGDALSARRALARVWGRTTKVRSNSLPCA